MAIKISNITVIDDSRNLLNANTIVFASNTLVKLPAGGTASRPVSPANGSIRYNTDDGAFEGYAAGEWGPVGAGISIIQKPTNTSPAAGETEVSLGPALDATNFRHVYNKTKAYGVWQVSTSSTFATTVVNANVASTSNSYTITSGTLTANTSYFWRVKYGDSDGVESSFSTATSFTTGTPPTVLGQSYQGGYYTGTIDIGGGVCYYLVVAPNSVGCACCFFTTNDPAVEYGGESCVNGYDNTYCYLTSANYPAGNWTATRTINGYSDWYLPSRNELNVMYNNSASMPAGQGYASGFTYYWTSSEDETASCDVFHRCMSGPMAAVATDQRQAFRVRAIRRVPI